MSDLAKSPRSAATRSAAEDIPVLLLVGGLGTRLRPVLSSTPKALAPVGNVSFLELILRQLRCQGFRRVVMCTGYLGDQIRDTFGNGNHLGLDIAYSEERSPMGTAGAVLLAQAYVGEASNFVVMNGDSFIDLDFAGVLDFHHAHNGIATMVVRLVENAGRYGTVHVDAAGRIDRFVEKTGNEAPGLINAGVYVFEAAILDDIHRPSSLERDIFPGILDRGIFAIQESGVFIDIGTPQDYARAQSIFQRLYDAAVNDPAGGLPPHANAVSGVTS